MSNNKSAMVSLLSRLQAVVEDYVPFLAERYQSIWTLLTIVAPGHATNRLDSPGTP